MKKKMIMLSDKIYVAHRSEVYIDILMGACFVKRFAYMAKCRLECQHERE